MTTPPPLPPLPPQGDAGGPIPFATPVAPPPVPQYGPPGMSGANPFGVPSLECPPLPPPPSGNDPGFSIHWAAFVALVPFVLVRFIAGADRATAAGLEDARAIGFQMGYAAWPVAIAALLAWVAFKIFGRPRQLSTGIFLAIYVLFTVPSFVALVRGPKPTMASTSTPSLDASVYLRDVPKSGTVRVSRSTGTRRASSAGSAGTAGGPGTPGAPVDAEAPNGVVISPSAPRDAGGAANRGGGGTAGGSPFVRPGRGGIQIAGQSPGAPAGPRPTVESLEADATRMVLDAHTQARTAAQKFKQAGGWNMSGVRTPADLEQRIAANELVVARLKGVREAYAAGAHHLRMRLTGAGVAATDLEGKIDGWGAGLRAEQEQQVALMAERVFASGRDQLRFLRRHWGQWKYDPRMQGCKFDTLQLLEQFNKHQAEFRSAQKAVNEAVNRAGGTQLQIM
jgi:hypothetical protein